MHKNEYDSSQLLNDFLLCSGEVCERWVCLTPKCEVSEIKPNFIRKFVTGIFSIFVSLLPRNNRMITHCYFLYMRVIDLKLPYLSDRKWKAIIFKRITWPYLHHATVEDWSPNHVLKQPEYKKLLVNNFNAEKVGLVLYW